MLDNMEYSEAQIKTEDEGAEELNFLARRAEIFCEAYEARDFIVKAILEAEPT
jgi:hypothetical protein